MKKRNCFGLRSVCWVLLVFGVGVFFGLVPYVAYETREMAPEYSAYFWPCLGFFAVIAAAYALALAAFWKIVDDIERDRSFCMENARRMRLIGYLTGGAGAWLVAGCVTLAALNMLHPGILLAALALTAFCFVVSLLARAISKLTVRACEIKEENDLTV